MIFSVLWDLSRDRRFVDLWGKLGPCDYWAKSDRWPDCTQDGLLTCDFRGKCRRLAAA